MVNFVELFAGIALLIGSLFILISAIGLIKMPDIFLRMSATTKAVTFGVSFVLIGASIFFGDIGTITRSVVIILFLFLTAPVAAHMIGRAAYFDGVYIWQKTIVNEMENKYFSSNHKRKVRRFNENDELIGPENDTEND
ncbi:MAG: monovalent cation/H(+) antiporter subunit G [Candidatus Kapabacteria bacterium]|nr:monovalent cation/H(+) antiporter subunit G [Ignavibacteriota bacterium]MCW5886190.1 monovalent cation/H(+) antiporter subunit G [Candidatus Kapabacteria bacterium]